MNDKLVKAAERNAHYEVEEELNRGRSPNACDEDGRPVLYICCARCHKSLAQLLIARGANVNRPNYHGRTPLMRASINGHDELVDILVSAKANVALKDKAGDTAFDFAMEFVHMAIAGRLVLATRRVEDFPVETRPLVFHWACKSKRVDVARNIIELLGTEWKDKNGRDALSIAAVYQMDIVDIINRRLPSSDNVRTDVIMSMQDLPVEICRFIFFWVCKDKKVDAAKSIMEQLGTEWRDDLGRTLLHYAARYGSREVVELLLSNKADPDVVDKDGKRPHQLTDSELRRRLRRAIEKQKFADLFAKGAVRPDIIKLCFIGSEGAGKTTLMEALQRGWLEWIFKSENKEDDPYCEEERTIGINVMTANIPGVGRVSLRDHAGQKQFHKTHGLFFYQPNSFFILLVSLLRGKERRQCSNEELREELQYWLSFLRASLGAGFIPTVLIAASRGDSRRDGQRVLQRVVDYLRDLFEGKINILQDCLVLDCRRSSSPEMRHLKKILCDMKHQLRLSASLYPLLCQSVVSKLLPALRKKQKDPFMETATLMEKIEQEACPGLEKEVVEKVVDFLDHSGEIAVAGDVAALNPACLHQYAIGPIIASEDFKWHIKSERNDGTVTREEAETSINHFLKDQKIDVQLNTDKVLAVNEILGLSFKVEGRDDKYMFPALLPPKDLSVMWKGDESKQVYVGRRYTCKSPTTIFSPSAFGMFQSEVRTTLDPEARLWRDGMIIARGDAVSTNVECLVAMIDRVRSVDFVSRGGARTEVECVSLLDDVMSLWRDVLDNYSPGTEYETKYLSRKHLLEHKELKQVTAYSNEKIQQAKLTNKGASATVREVVGDELETESLGDLLVFQCPNQTALTTPNASFNAVIDCGSSQWYSFGLGLGFSHDQIEALCHDKVTPADKLAAIIQVKTKQVGDVKNMDDLLLEACRRLPNPIDGAVRKNLGIHH